MLAARMMTDSTTEELAKVLRYLHQTLIRANGLCVSAQELLKRLDKDQQGA